MLLSRSLSAAVLCATLSPLASPLAQAADLDYLYAPPPRVAYERPVVVERPVVIEQPVVVERRVVVERPAAFYPRRPYAYARRLPPPFYRPYRHLAYGARPYGYYGY